MSAIAEPVLVESGADLSERAQKSIQNYKTDLASYPQRLEDARRLKRTEPEPPAAPSVVTVVRVPRAICLDVADVPWRELKELARRGERGMSLYVVTGVERPPVTEAWLEDCHSTGMLQGRACLYAQGWDANTPAIVSGKARA